MCIKGKIRLVMLFVLVGCPALSICGAWYLFTRFGKCSEPVKTALVKPDAGRWRRVNTAADKRRTFEQEVNRLSSLPYLQGYKKAPSEQNVTVYDPSMACDGLNLYNSGHAPQAGIMDMKGNVLHRWTYDFAHIPHQLKIDKSGPFWEEATTHWRRVHLYENGDLLVMYDGLLMIKLDRNSNLLWVCPVGGFHHHMQVAENGNIYALARLKRIVPIVNKSEKILEDFILILNPDGELIGEYSLLDCFMNSSYRHILNRMPVKGDIFHTNTLQIIDEKLSDAFGLFKKGDVLISALYLNTIATVNLETKRVTWASDGHKNGLWNGMHEPVMLENGNILIFDNNWVDPGLTGQSRVIEFNPFTEKVVWLYQGDQDHPFYSRTCGTNQRLPNGNTLITESDNGRAFEVTKDGNIVWEYISPHRAGENDELIATLLHINRIDRNYVKWLTSKEQ